MKIEMLNPYVIKILISLRKEDSISSVSKRINLSYGWTNKWVNELIKEGILKEKWRGVVINEDNESYKKIIKFIKENLNDVSFYYSALELFGIDYCLTKTDAVYVWTEGRYNIARFKDYYPIFIKIKKADYNIFLEYCKKLGLKINSYKGVFYSIEVVEELKCERKENYSVDSLNDTIKFMQENIYNFEPALEMIEETYNKKLGVKYREANRL
jgi:DNA-binding Lrp family transcriptional regulator